MANLTQKIENFLKKNLKGNAPLLVGFSGGPDSLAITHILLSLQKKYAFEVELAHIDHSFRPESYQQALELKSWAEKNNLAFHLMKIDVVPAQNIEDYFRKERYHFFNELLNKKKYQALVLAHHQNDLEETVLKRVLEGSHIEYLGAFDEVSSFSNNYIWRPFLFTCKEEILNYIQTHSLNPVNDPTNFDGKNLRSKMRCEIIPTLEKQFGKNIRSNLQALAKSSKEFNRYFLKRFKDLDIHHASFLGSYFDFSHLNLHPFELQFVLRHQLKKVDLVLNRIETDTITSWLIDNVANQSITHGKKLIYIDRQKLFLFNHNWQELPIEPQKVELGIFSYGPWQVSVEEGREAKESHLGWKGLFKKNNPTLFFQLPLGQYLLKKGDLKIDRCLFYQKKLGKVLSEHSVPSAIAHHCPVIVSKCGQVVEFLSGRDKKILSGPYLNISLTYKKD